MRAVAHLLAQLSAAGMLAAAVSCEPQHVDLPGTSGTSGTSGRAADSGMDSSADQGDAEATPPERPAAPTVPNTAGSGGPRVAATAICNDADYKPLSFYLSWGPADPSADSGSNHYEGWATIESSTTTKLMLSVVREDFVASGDDAGVDTEQVSDHFAIEALEGALPVLPVGKRAWLASYDDPDRTPPEVFPKRLSNGSSFALSTGKGRELIVAAANVPDEVVTLGPLTIATPQAMCWGQGTTCFGGTEVRYSLAVYGGDSTLRIHEGAQADVVAGAVTYDLSLLRARKQMTPMPPTTLGCADGSPDDRMWIWVHVQPKNPSSVSFELDD